MPAGVSAGFAAAAGSVLAGSAVRPSGLCFSRNRPTTSTTTTKTVTERITQKIFCFSILFYACLCRSRSTIRSTESSRRRVVARSFRTV